MISVVLYGRNDSYGYNLHKRAALSLNCIAAVLTNAADEILFVDYNTPDDFPTFPEAIQDTLTPRARKMLRILRVRPRHHQRFADRTHLVALEPVARNVAIRRSNPENRWILSTNTDMIFVPRSQRSLSDIVATARNGFYHLPRFEIPESLWESLDRLDPIGTIARIGEWGRSFHLNEVVHAHDPWVKFDGPGDFQLMLREDLFHISGFHEDMLLGWHVDSNIARRLSLLRGKTSDLLDELFGYHCDHTRQVTPAHRAGSVQNDIVKFNDQVTSPVLPEHADSWGLAGETIEELTVDYTSNSYVQGLARVIRQEMTEPSHVTYSTATFDKVEYDIPHVLPFLTDIFASYPRNTRIGWYGFRRQMLEAFSEASREMGFSEAIMVAEGMDSLGPQLPKGCQWTPLAEIDNHSDAFVFECGGFRPVRQLLANRFRRTVRVEAARLRQKDAMPRRVIAVNAIHNEFEGLISSQINAARSPMASRIRQGFVVVGQDRTKPQDLFPLFASGGAGRRDQGKITAVPGKAGYVIYGPYLSLDAGHYRLTLAFEADSTAARTDGGSLALEVFADPYLLAVCSIRHAVVTGGSTSMSFTLSEELIELMPWLRVEFRIHTDGTLPVSLWKATLEAVSEAADGTAAYEFLPLLTRGRAAEGGGRINQVAAALTGRRIRGGSADGVRAISGKRGHVVSGPYVAMPPGHYEATFELHADKSAHLPSAAHEAPIVIDVVADKGNKVIACRHINPAHNGGPCYSLPFEIPAGPESPELLEFRVWSNGTLGFLIPRVTARQLPPDMAPRRDSH